MKIDKSKIEVDLLRYGAVTIGRGNEEVILAMANSGDYTLSEAFAVYTAACERCANVLAWKYTKGKHGYPEYSEQWNKTNTECEFCKDEPNYIKANRDDIEEAIHCLDRFSKNWCMNVEETITTGKPVFRCSNCEFGDGHLCSIKCFVKEHEPQALNTFGCMNR